MKTKTIPFRLETAKKIQAGEIKGKIKDIDGFEGTIVTFDGINTPLPIVVKFSLPNGGDTIFFVGNDGVSTQIELFLEVPDNEPQFKPFDKVLVRNKSTERWHPSLYATTDGLLYYTIDCKNWQQCTTYEGNEHLVGTTNKPKED